MNYKYKGLEIRPIMREMLVGDKKPLTEKRFVTYEVIGDNVVYPFKTMDQTDGSVAGGWGYAEEIPSNKFRSIEDGLLEDDIIVNPQGKKRKVLGICGKAIFLSSIADFTEATTYYFTLIELIKRGWKLDNQESKEVELTIEEIAKLKGVDPKLIRIKD